MSYIKKPPAPGGTDKLTVLTGHSFFSDLPSEILNRIVGYIKSRSYASGAPIFGKGEVGHSLFLICEGTVKICAQTDEGKEVVFSLLGKGELFGEIAVLDGLPRTANAEAFTECELIVIDRRELLNLLEAYPPFAMGLLKILCSRLRKTSEQVESIMFVDASGRLAKTLLELSSDPEHPGRIDASQREVAQIAGVSRELANKQLRKWAKADWIRLGRRNILLLERDPLLHVIRMAERVIKAE